MHPQLAGRRMFLGPRTTVFLYGPGRIRTATCTEEQCLSAIDFVRFSSSAYACCIQLPVKVCSRWSMLGHHQTYNVGQPSPSACEDSVGMRRATLVLADETSACNSDISLPRVPQTSTNNKMSILVLERQAETKHLGCNKGTLAWS